MREKLGPHALTFVAPDGAQGSITMTINPAPDQFVDLGEGHTFREVAGSIEIRSDWFSRTFSVTAVDDIQLVFRMVRLADIYVQKICETMATHCTSMSKET